MDVLEHERSRYRKRGLWTLVGLVLYASHGLIAPLLTPLYQKLLVNYGEVVTYIVIVLLVHHATYIVLGILTTLMCVWPGLQKYKINVGEWPMHSDYALIKRTLVVLLWNFIVFLPGYVIVTKSLSMTQTSMDFEVPSVLDNVKWLPLCQAADSVWTYWTHALLHTRWLYTKIHKKHHEYRVSIGIAGEYAHPLEYFFVNILGASLGPTLIGKRMHLLGMVTWVFFKISHTIDNHSGFDAPWSPYSVMPLSSKWYVAHAPFHDFHHYDNSGNYGNQYMFLDYICGTSSKYLSQLKKHKS